MRILFLSTWLPYPPNHGNRIRTYNLLTRLARNHDITLVSFIADSAECQHIPILEGQSCHKAIVVQHDPFAPRRLRSALSCLSTTPRFLYIGYCVEMRRVIDQVVSAARFDVLIAEVMIAGFYGQRVPGLPKIYDDLEIAQFLKPQDVGEDILRRAKHACGLSVFRRFLRGILADYDACTVPSRQEQQLISGFLNCSQDRLPLLPNGVDVSGHERVVPLAEEQPYLVFNGSLTFKPNLEAMEFFLRDIWPRIKGAHPSIRLKITGPFDHVDIGKLRLTSQVELTGYLDDVLPTVAGAQACVVPLLTGGGTRLKVLEAMALGVPVVATSKAVEGLDVLAGQHALVADTADEFADAMLRLLGDADLRRELAASARLLVRQRYNWEAITDQFESLIQDVVEKHSRDRQFVG